MDISNISDSSTFIIILFSLGLVAMLIEIFIPGMIVGLCGVVAATASIVMAFNADNATLGITLTAIAVAFVPIFLILWRHAIGNFFAVNATEKGFAAAPSGLSELINREGVALTNLRPSGAAKIGDKRVDVVADGEMIPQNARVEVTEVHGNRVVVRSVKA